MSSRRGRAMVASPMRLIGVALCVLALACSSVSQTHEPADSPENLAEYGCVFFGEGGYLGTLPPIGAPEIKVMNDGHLLIQERGSVQVGMLDHRALSRVLREVEQVQTKHPRATLLRVKGEPLLMHGGFCYLAIGSQPSTMLVAQADPSGGATGALVRLLKKTARSLDKLEEFEPESVVISVSMAEESGAPPWPFPDQLDLLSIPPNSAYRVTAPEVASSLVNWSMSDPDSKFKLAGKTVVVRVLDIPGWYSPATRDEQLKEVLGPLGWS